MESFEHDGTYIGMLRNLTTILSICQEHAKKVPRRWRENAKETLRITWKCNNKQHKHPVPAKHEEEALKYWILRKWWDIYRNGEKTYNNTKQMWRTSIEKNQENAKGVARKCQGNVKETQRIIGKCSNNQHKHRVPAKHEEEALKYMESLENNGTYVGMLRKLTAIRSKCQENAKKMPRKCQGLPRKCQEHA